MFRNFRSFIKNSNHVSLSFCKCRKYIWKEDLKKLGREECKFILTLFRMAVKVWSVWLENFPLFASILFGMSKSSQCNINHILRTVVFRYLLMKFIFIWKFWRPSRFGTRVFVWFFSWNVLWCFLRKGLKNLPPQNSRNTILQSKKLERIILKIVEKYSQSSINPILQS